MSHRFDVCAIGNAMVDIIVPASDAFLAENGVTKGSMTLVDDERSATLYERAGGTAEMTSGGSAANTLAGCASLGGTCAFLGKIGRDEFGKVFAHDLHAQKVHFEGTPSPQLATGRCLVLVTPDAQRSMNTFLGAASEFGPADVTPDVVQGAAVTYLEGYLFDKPEAQAAFRKAAQLVHQAGRKLALTLSDSFCVHRHREAFLDLIANEVDILFANEEELKALYQTSDIAAALSAVHGHAEIAVVTRGAQGAHIVEEDAIHEISAHPVAKLVDTTGAGDLYAAGFLYGVTTGKALTEAARIGAIAAAEAIGHYGPRPLTVLSTLI
jgi:sugar/nucleoside kinase (ribokinase family)